LGPVFQEIKRPASEGGRYKALERLSRR